MGEVSRIRSLRERALARLARIGADPRDDVETVDEFWPDEAPSGADEAASGADESA